MKCLQRDARPIPPRQAPLLAVLVCAAACGDTTVAETDGGPTRRDATVVDAGLQLDASDAGGREDAGVDAAVECPVGSCDPLTPNSCDEERFCLVQESGPACVEAVGVGTEGSLCRASSDCGPGLACFAEAGGEGSCARPCCPGDIEVCPGGQRCTGAGVLVEGDFTGWFRCVVERPCDLFADDACGPGEACYIVDGEGTTDCRRAGAGSRGEPCRSQNDCAAGLFCGGLTSPTCREICRLRDGATACLGSEECRGYPHTPDGAGICT